MEFQRFFRLKFPQVKKFAVLLLKSETDAEDIAQDVFFKLWTTPELWHNKTDELDNYLFIMAKNRVLNEFKHQKVEEEFRNDVLSTEELIEISGRDDILDDVYYKELLLLLQLTVKRMPEKRRKIFEMSRFQHLSNKEIAERLGLSVRTVEHQIYLSLSEIKKTIYIFLFFLNFFK